MLGASKKCDGNAHPQHFMFSTLAKPPSVDTWHLSFCTFIELTQLRLDHVKHSTFPTHSCQLTVGFVGITKTV